MKEKAWESVKEILSIVIIAFVLAMILRLTLIECRFIPSGSMLPTLQLNTRVVVMKFAYWFQEPERGDIIVFKPPEELEVKDDYIKRVIGFPGEEIYIHDGVVYVDERALIEPYVQEAPNYTFGPTIVPDDSLFVLGDNRNLSHDSHAWNVWLQQDHIKGKAVVIYWPLSEVSLLERGIVMEPEVGL